MTKQINEDLEVEGVIRTVSQNDGQGGRFESNGNQVRHSHDESGTISAASASGLVTTNVALSDTYSSGLAFAGMIGVSPLTGAASVVGVTTNANGNIDGITVQYENSDTVAHDVNWRFFGNTA